MSVSGKRIAETVPDYSLTGDLLSYLRCGLQYRYHNGSALPPSRPVQLWFGEFIHGVLEAAYRIWDASKIEFPWPCNVTPFGQAPESSRDNNDVGVIGETVEATLAAQGKIPRSEAARNAAYERANRTVNELGPELFPLIAAAEQPVIGTRTIPKVEGERARADIYELHGVIDVVTHFELSEVDDGNFLKQVIVEQLGAIEGPFEVLVDYKGAGRPEIDDSYWEQHLWQLQTYAWLRSRQPEALPVRAALLIYVNELAPRSGECHALKRMLAKEATDVLPARGSSDRREVEAWSGGTPLPALSREFRMRRAVRVEGVDGQSMAEATRQFDEVVSKIEACACREEMNGAILKQWPTTGDEETCAACDFRYFCPEPYSARHNRNGEGRSARRNSPKAP